MAHSYCVEELSLDELLDITFGDFEEQLQSGNITESDTLPQKVIDTENVRIIWHNAPLCVTNEKYKHFNLKDTLDVDGDYRLSEFKTCKEKHSWLNDKSDVYRVLCHNTLLGSIREWLGKELIQKWLHAKCESGTPQMKLIIQVFNGHGDFHEEGKTSSLCFHDEKTNKKIDIFTKDVHELVKPHLGEKHAWWIVYAQCNSCFPIGQNFVDSESLLISRLTTEDTTSTNSLKCRRNRTSKHVELNKFFEYIRDISKTEYKSDKIHYHVQ